jgi:hypothetical protein
MLQVKTGSFWTGSGAFLNKISKTGIIIAKLTKPNTEASKEKMKKGITK